MVDPRHHGSGVADALVASGPSWLGLEKPIWLNVISYNDRAIRFYGRFGFEIDFAATTTHVIPHFVMRRMPKLPSPGSQRGCSDERAA